MERSRRIKVLKDLAKEFKFDQKETNKKISRKINKIKGEIKFINVEDDFF